jgi:hypothetical protein
MVLNLRSIADSELDHDAEKTNTDRSGGTDRAHLSSVVDIGPWWRAEGYRDEPFAAHTPGATSSAV